MNAGEISPETGRRIKIAAWSSVIFALLLFYVFGYFPLLMLIVSQTSLLDSPPDWLDMFLQWTVFPLGWLREVSPALESYYDGFIPNV